MSSSGKRKKAEKQGKKTSSFKDTYEGLSDTAKQDYLNYMEALTQLKDLQEDMGSAQTSYDEALAEYEREQQKRLDVLQAKNDAMFIDKVDQFGNVIGRQTRGYERGFGDDYNPNRAMQAFDRMLETIDKRIDYGVENRGEFVHSDEKIQRMLDHMKAFGNESQYDEMIDKLKDVDSRTFDSLQFAKDYDAAQMQYAPELTAAASTVQAMRDQYVESSAEAEAAYDQYLEAYKKLSGMKYGDQYGGAAKGLGMKQGINMFRELGVGNNSLPAGVIATAANQNASATAASAPDFEDLGGNTGLGFDLYDQEQINAMSSEELAAYLEDLMEYYG